MIKLTTPETDAFDCELNNPRVLQDRYSEMLEHARKLERERDEARDELCHLRACVFDVMSALDAGAFTELRKAWEEGAK